MKHTKKKEMNVILKLLFRFEVFLGVWRWS
jgi:hypothetical protein